LVAVLLVALEAVSELVVSATAESKTEELKTVAELKVVAVLKMVA
jgi:hypothetical protein